MSDTHTSEEMTSFEVLHTQNGMPESLDETDFSFMPDHPYLSGECAGNVQNHRQFDMTNLQSTLSCATPDLSVEEIHRRLIELLEENETMKEALKRNNVMMEEQLTTISAWHQQMTLSKAQQQESLLKEKESRSAFEKQNAELLVKIKELEKKCQNAAENQVCSKCETAETAVKKLQEEKDSLLSEKDELAQELKQEKQFHRQLEQNVLQVSNYLENLQTNSKLLEAEKRELTALNNMLQLKLSTLDSDFDTIIHTDEETGYEIVQQRRIKDDLLRETLTNLTETQEKVHMLTEKVIQQTAEIDSLRKCSESSSKDLANFEKQGKGALNASSDASEQSSDSNLIAFESKRRCQALEQKDYLNQLEDIKKELEENLQEILKAQQQECKVDRLKLNERTSECIQLEADKERMSKLLEIQSKDEMEKMKLFDDFKEHEIKCHLEHIDKLTAQLVDKELTLEDQLQKTMELTSQLKTVKEDAEALPILKAQVEIYKVNLQNAICARESAHEEVQRLTSELKTLRAAPPCCFNCGKSLVNTEVKSRIRTKGRSESRSPAAESSADHLIICPICQFGFSSLQAAENHVNKCIDKS